LSTATVEADRTFVESYHYNNLDQATSVTDSAGHTSLFTPELDGRVVSSTDREGHTTQTKYTLLSELAAVQLPNGVTRSNYYNAGRDLRRISDHNGHATEWQFDPLH